MAYHGAVPLSGGGAGGDGAEEDRGKKIEDRRSRDV
jgi:hypothetical protein